MFGKLYLMCLKGVVFFFLILTLVYLSHFLTHLSKGGGVTTLPKIFSVQPPILMILVLEDGYESSSFSIDTKKGAYI